MHGLRDDDWRLYQRNRDAGPLAQLTSALFRETSPAPLKYALSLLGLMSAKVRLPLVEPMPETQDKVRHAMRHAGVLN